MLELLCIAAAQVTAAPAAHVLAAPGSYQQGAQLVELLEVDGALALSRDQKSYVKLLPLGDRKFCSDAGDIIHLIGAKHTLNSGLLLNGLWLPRTDVGLLMERQTVGWYQARDVAQLRAAAMATTATVDPKATRAAELVEVVTLDPTIKAKAAYATADNFGGVAFYEADARIYLQAPAAHAVARAAQKLKTQGYGLWLHDGYRPWFVTKMFWDAAPEAGKIYVADPAKGSRHNRGAAIDLTLYDLKTGAPVQMPSRYDEFSHRSWVNALAGTSAQRLARDVLRAAMEAEGFKVYAEEWWHFDFSDWRSYPIMNIAPDADAAVNAAKLYPGLEKSK
jgi:zinc D-Ala-D-Ala dipeptidase